MGMAVVLFRLIRYCEEKKGQLTCGHSISGLWHLPNFFIFRLLADVQKAEL